MTTYEKFKAAALVCACIMFLAVGIAAITVSDSVNMATVKLQSTLVTAQAAFDSLLTVGPQTTRTLQQLADTTKDIGQQAVQLTNKAGFVADNLSTTLAAVNRPCGAADDAKAKPCGTLADLNRTMATIRGATGQIEAAARHEDKNLANYDKQEQQLYTDIHTTTLNLNDLIASPDLARFLKSSADTSMQVAIIATEGAGIAKDVHKEADQLVAPQPWYKKAYGFASTTVNVACLVTHSCPF
jgi:hypothetical protein